MDSVRSAFHTQLAAVMDTLLAAAVCEIAKIFESSMCEQQAEISSLLAKLEQVERRQRTKAGQVGTAGDRGDILRPKAPREPGKAQDGAGNNSQSEPKEITDSITSIKQEPPLGSFMVQVPEESLAITDRTTTDTLTETHIQAELSHWDQGRPTEDHRLQQESASPSFFTISQTGHWSPRHDSSPAHPRQWLPRMDDTRGGQKSLQATGTSCFVAAAASIGTDVACLQPETNSKDENDPFVLKEQKTENFNQTSGQGQRAEQTGVQQLQSQVLSPWRHNHDDRSGLFSHMRRTSFSNRDPLRLQSNSVSLKTRQADPLTLSASPSAGNGRPYTCLYCAKSFTYPSHQRRHLLRHTGVRLHPCQFCDKSFLTPSELTVHTRTHTGERPFGCPQCGKRFARSGNLRAHQRDVHMQKRPFACAECGKRFAHRGNLRAHNHRVHQGDPYYMEHQQEPDIAPNPT